MTPALYPEEPSVSLSTQIIGKELRYSEECASTNDLAREYARQGAADGTVVLSGYQHAGRGRLQRAWIAPRGSSLLFSLILRPKIPLERSGEIPMAAGLGTIEGIRAQCGMTARLKWPNDILLRGRKAGGILVETELDNSTLDYAIAGIGVNVNFRVADIPGIPQDATSLLQETGHPVPRAILLANILGAIDSRYRALCAGASLFPEWSAMLDTIGQRVRVEISGRTLTGTVDRVEQDGSLILCDEHGEAHRFFAGDVIHLRNNDSDYSVNPIGHK